MWQHGPGNAWQGGSLPFRSATICASPWLPLRLGSSRVGLDAVRVSSAQVLPDPITHQWDQPGVLVRAGVIGILEHGELAARGLVRHLPRLLGTDQLVE